MIQKIKNTGKRSSALYRTYRKQFFRYGLAVFLIWYLFCLPAQLFNDPTSTVLLDEHQNLLGAKIADDGQWRFSESDSIPSKFETCIVEFEDKNFHSHIGISLKGVGRAIIQNFKNKKVVSGGSTITMQLARIMRKNPPRTYGEKIHEMILATRIETRYSKEEILRMYASHAPFGNNVVGLEAASWRYFGRSSDKLSWSESATLAVLPNAPGLIYPGKNHTSLMNKRNRLLRKLYDQHVINKTTFFLAISEPLPNKPLPLPRLAPHLLTQLMKEGQKGKTIVTTIQKRLQENTASLLQSHSYAMQDNMIYNGAVMITSVKTGEILAYVGNTSSDNSENGNDVNCIKAARSTGSILKPLLYAKSMEDGLLTPTMLLQDVPSQFGGFSPKNFAGNYEGALSANTALSRSLNIPMVHLLNNYGLSKFHRELKNYGLSTLNKPANHYGLSLILGGAEATLYDLSKVYTQMAQELEFGKSIPIDVMAERSLESYEVESPLKTDKACIYSTFEAMTEVNRPDEDNNWKIFNSEQKIAWKTGTSFGFRDAWAIGITPDYVVAVWIGNADGEGRPGLTGVNAAAPLLFNLFKTLPKSQTWFKKPFRDMAYTKICHESGHRASKLCPVTEMQWIPKTSLGSVACPYHQIIHLNQEGTMRVDSDCESLENMRHETWFVLPSIVEKFYKTTHPNYAPLPEFKPECLSRISDRSMGIIYPKPKSKIYVPIELDGKMGKTIFEATHRNNTTKIFWHLDEEYIGETKEIHQVALNPSIGQHHLTLVDENGISVNVKFEVIGKRK